MFHSRYNSTDCFVFESVQTLVWSRAWAQDLSPGGGIVLGVIVGLISTSIQSIGLTLQRKSHLLEDGRDAAFPKRPAYRRRRWQLGMGMFILSNLLGSSIQITTLPLVILSPLQASGLVFNSVCATLLLNEPFTRRSLVGTVLVCAGAGIIAAFGAMSEPAHSLDELLDLMARRPFVIWMIWQATLVSAILIGAQVLKTFSARRRDSRRLLLLRGLAYGAVSGILSAHSLLVAKTAVELLVRTIVDRVNQFNRWQSWVSLLGLATLALTQLYYMHRGLKLVTTSILYPLVFCIYNIIAILDGLIYFKQLPRLSALHAGLVALGVVVLLLGVLALSWRLHQEDSQAPMVPQSALSPGLGLLNDEEDRLAFADDDELSIDQEPREQTPLLGGGGIGRRRKRADTRTQVLRQDRILAKTRSRRIEIAEANEIWGELADDLKQVRPIRRTRTRSLGSVTLPRMPTALASDSPKVESLVRVRQETGKSLQDQLQKPATVKFLDNKGRAASSHFPASSGVSLSCESVDRPSVGRQSTNTSLWNWGTWWRKGQDGDDRREPDS